MYIETTRGEQSIKLYVIPGILESTHFEPRKRKEIGEIQWIPVHLIPGWARFSKNCNSLLGLSTAETSSFSQNAGGVEHFSRTKDCTGHSQMRFWNVYPFAESLVGWMHLVKLSLKPNNVSRFLPSSVTTTPQVRLTRFSKTCVHYLKPVTPLSLSARISRAESVVKHAKAHSVARLCHATPMQRTVDRRCHAA